MRFSRKTESLIEDSTILGRAAQSASRSGDHLPAAVVGALSDEKFDQWLDATEREHNARNGRR